MRHTTNKACGYGHGERDQQPGGPGPWAAALVNIADHTDASVGRYWSKYTGRLFDLVAAQGPFDRFTGADLYACEFLSAGVDRRVGAQLLDDDADHCSSLLRAIPVDVSIASARAALILEDDGPASQLYKHLRDIDGVGPTTASKLLSVKRPALIPIRDSFVEQALGAGSDKRWWQPMHEAWEDPRVGEAVQRLRLRAGDAVPPHVADLRLLDVAVWLSVKQS